MHLIVIEASLTVSSMVGETFPCVYGPIGEAVDEITSTPSPPNRSRLYHVIEPIEVHTRKRIKKIRYETCYQFLNIAIIVNDIGYRNNYTHTTKNASPPLPVRLAEIRSLRVIISIASTLK
mmetsp:Transcript_25375/g.29384  ORF Transcript_25375/g.29384 Transcript_25375/m.29384 type:complete len:121 (+) Transcript_25375:890-1252(+)